MTPPTYRSTTRDVSEAFSIYLKLGAQTMAKAKAQQQTWIDDCMKAWNAPKPLVTGLWDTVDAEVLRDVIAAISTTGSAIMIGLTVDQGAMSVTIFAQSGKSRFYEHDGDVMTQRLQMLLNAAGKGQNGTK